MKFWNWGKKVNPLVSEKERAVQDITDQLISWSKYSDRQEILAGVLSRVFAYRVHLHKNPRRKEA